MSMRKRFIGSTATILGSLLGTTLFVPAAAAQVTQEMLENSDSTPENWLHSLGNYSAHRYSRLSEITPENAAGLKVAFTLPVPTALLGAIVANLQNPPLVLD